MGRALKIRKTNNTDGINGNQIDAGFPNNGSTNNGFTRNQPGIVGGIDQYANEIECQARVVVKGLGKISAGTGSTGVTGTGTSFTTDAMIDGNTQILVADSTQPYGYTILGVLSSITNAGALVLQANSSIAVTNSAWYYSTETNQAAIIRQKGSSKFLVYIDVNIQDESIAKGQAYMIMDPSDTDWQALGAGPNAGYGDVFTAVKDGTGLTTNGYVVPVSICVLVDESAPSNQNTMSIGLSQGTGYASRIKNKFATDFSTPYADSNPGTTFSATFGNNGSNLPDPAAAGDLVYTTTQVENWC